MNATNCNMLKTLLQHQYTTIPTSKKAVATSPVRARGGCRSFPAPATTTADDKSPWLRLETGCTADGGWGGGTLVRRRGWGRAAAHARRRSGPCMAATLARRLCSCGRPPDTAAPPPNRDESERARWSRSRGWRGTHSPTTDSGTKEASRRSGARESPSWCAGRARERPDHDERRRRRVLDLQAQTTGGGETGGNGKVEHQGSQIRARFWQRWPEDGDPAAAAAVRSTGRGAAALQGVGLRLFFYSRDRAWAQGA
jgi:hypothetical protein